ncbi:hypothetical protein CEUSTIGMA_g1649.t1 [Chlamydomonas eustigma]|uniref:Mitochondrial carrier protein n=1 Tax=Chlamydomonas eustigma TaxID=1157962 RepID=A0A250WUH0_9CHLO|nr:hypothetical protein CEUSTIGMA_g1649.t1 [Chlamydomonas eustigma]|eukprot:GAX74200.1 hypothetical protein CEUSTIGMA_g1649.t1 [Chlamydomonas eustigma]
MSNIDSRSAEESAKQISHLEHTWQERPSDATGSGSVPLASTSQATLGTRGSSVTSSKKSNQEKTITDVIAGALARAASQSTIHPLDTLKVRIQAGRGRAGTSNSAGLNSTGLGPPVVKFQHMMTELGSLYKGVLGAATGAGIIIGSYFAFYSSTKQVLRKHTDLSDGAVAFVSGGTAAVGSSVVKVPIAVCIRSVQAGVYQNAIHAAQSITKAAGVRGLFTGFVPTLLEDVPDMAVKFAVYESMRTIYFQLTGRQPAAIEDLLMGGSAGAAAAAATTPLDVVKTRMMCSASQRPTITAAVQGVVEEGLGWKGFFRGMGPRALSNGINSAVFFCFFEAIRKVLISKQSEVLTPVLQGDLVVQPAQVTAGCGSRPASISLVHLNRIQYRCNSVVKLQSTELRPYLSIALPVSTVR